MGTDKRSRQRANRAAKLAEEAKAARKASVFKRIRRVVIYALLIAAVILLANQVFGGDDSDQAITLLLVL